MAVLNQTALLGYPPDGLSYLTVLRQECKVFSVRSDC